MLTYLKSLWNELTASTEVDAVMARLDRDLHQFKKTKDKLIKTNSKVSDAIDRVQDRQEALQQSLDQAKAQEDMLKQEQKNIGSKIGKIKELV